MRGWDPLVWLQRTRWHDILLDAKASSTALREGNEILVEIFSAGFGFDPPLGPEDVRIWEYVGVVVE